MTKKMRPFLMPVILLFILTNYTFSQQKFYIDLNDRSTNIFTVTLVPDKLTEKNNIYQFAATAPGTYQTMNIGSYVKSFEAFDAKDSEITTKHISTNQWALSSPRKIKKIIYRVADTWNTKVDSDYIYAMSGSVIAKNDVLINGQCVFGYFEGMQSYPIKVKIDYPKDWLLGTALPLDKDGYYDADTYDKIVDSPILLGKLTKSNVEIGHTSVDVYTYSATGMIKSADMVNMLKNILNAENDFMEGLPVNHYTFLFHFENMDAGAWEHSYSSEYIFRETPLTDNAREQIKAVVAHEFFHILTPLNIHSELVAKFNFVKPVMSQHLWFYEGVTEWAAHILELRDSLITLQQYFDVLRDKLFADDSYKQDLSLIDLSIHSTEMQDQYPNIYMKGALAAGLLDIRLLKLSHGKRGLREVVHQLSKIYGPKRSFSEKNFFSDFTRLTYPEIADFFDKYIEHADKLPVKEYYNWLGIDYSELAGFDSSKVSLGIQVRFNKDNKLVVENVLDTSPNRGTLLPGDVLENWDGKEITLSNYTKMLRKTKTLKPGEGLNIGVLRDGKELDISAKAGAEAIKHIFKINPNATPEQINLRNAWLRNLKD
jgi:predicted metalloprotease with PDZ domain